MGGAGSMGLPGSKSASPGEARREAAFWEEVQAQV